MKEVIAEAVANAVAEAVAEAPKKADKKAKRTAEQIAANARALAQRKMDERVAKAIAAEKKKQEKREEQKTKRAANRNVARQTVKNRALSAARATGLPFTNEDLKIPQKGAKMEKIGDYIRAAKARYYKRTKLPDSITRAAIELAQQQGINVKHVKRTAKAKNVNAILAAARKKMDKTMGKTQRIEKRNEIIRHVMDHFPIKEPKEVQRLVCYRDAADRKKK